MLCCLPTKRALLMLVMKHVSMRDARADKANAEEDAWTTRERTRSF
jgi:hypothetical protein